MPRLYIKEYNQALVGKTVFIACREGILRDNFTEIIADIKFLNRQGIHTVFFHNISNRFANQKYFNELKSRLFNTKILRVLPDQDFYKYVLDYQDQVFKIIFLERKFLVDHKGQKLNSLTTQKARQKISAYGELIANTNFRNVIEQICQKIENEKIERVHILPAGKNTVKHELFTIEGSGTLIANNFTETFSRVITGEEVGIVADILKLYRSEGFLKPRTKDYIHQNMGNFFVVKIDGIIVGCAEKIKINQQTVELGALAISTKYRNQQIGLFLINSFLTEMKKQHFTNLISLTNNPQLEMLYFNIGFERKTLPEFCSRQKLSPTKKMFLKQL